MAHSLRGMNGLDGPRGGTDAGAMEDRTVANADEWRSLTHRFVVDGHKGNLTIATDEHDRPVHLEIRMSRAGAC